MTPLDMAYEFRTLAGQPVDVKISELDSNPNLKLAWDLIAEEWWELNEVAARLEVGGGEELVLKEICDLIYVLAGYCAFMGWNLDEALCRVHESNLSKLASATYREDGKVLKGDYKKADMKDCV